MFGMLSLPIIVHTETLFTVLELLFVKRGYSSLSLFSCDELGCAMSYLSTGLLCIVLLCCTCTIFRSESFGSRRIK